MGHIIVDQVSKRFRLYTDRPSSLKETVLSAARRRSRASQFGTEHHRRYDDFWALRDISFEIDEGTTFGMIGHNGSGKSTMLRLISGIYQPTTGTVDVEGRISALLELGAGFHPDLTGRENVYLNASVLGLGRAEIDRVIDDIIEFSGIEEFIDVPVKVYSSGMYVRLGFAVSVHVNPEILLIDEVVAVGDEEFQRKCFEHIYQLRRQGVTIVLVSHSLGLIQTMCDNAAWFDGGRVRSIGSTVDVAADYLRHVNQEEAGELAESGATVDDGGSRRGSGEVRFSDVSILDADGNRTMFAATGDDLIVRMDFDVTERIDSLKFGISFRHEAGQLISLTTTEADGLPIGAVSESGTVTFLVPGLPLYNGQYLLSFYAVTESGDHVYDEIERAFKLTVRGTLPRGKEGIVELGGNWTMTGGGPEA